jgi:nitrite reductase (NO-forming)
VLAVRLTPTAIRVGRAALAVVGTALVTIGVGLLVDARAVTALGYSIYAVGLVVAAVPMATAARAKPPAAAAALHIAFAMAWLTGTVVVWATFVGAASTWADAESQLGGLIAPIIVGAAAQIVLGSLSHLMPMVLGGGPTAVRAARKQVERGGSARVVLFNGGMLLFVLPTPSLVTVIGSMIALGAAVAALIAIVSGVVVSRRTQREVAADGPMLMSVQDIERERHPRGRGAALIAGCALLLAGAVGVAADPSASGVAVVDAAQSVAPTGRTVEVEVEAQDMRFTPSTIKVDPGDRLVIHVTNTDDTTHDLVLDSGASTGRVAAGASATIDIGVVGRAMDGWCSIAGHRQMGMVLSVVLTAQPEQGPDDGAADDGVSNEIGMPGHDMDGMTDDSNGTGASAADNMDLKGKPSFPARDASLAPASDTSTHELTIEVTDQVLEVAPGATQTLWTFNGGPNGPTLRGKVGDTFVVTLVNNGTMGHSIDFHASNVSPQKFMRTIEPGESLVYTFVAKRAGAWLYHCSTAPLSLHIANGMMGAVVIDPPDLEPVDKEFVFVQSEYYLGEQGGIADADKINAERPDLVVFNGYANQYRSEPIDVKVGERVRLWVVDAGPNRATSFHVVGGQFDTVFFEGAYALGGPGADSEGGAQALALQPGQGGFVELTFPEPGQYPFVSHIMVDAERGASGLFNVTAP